MTGLDLGVIGNSIVAALIDRRGRIVWHCLPRFDGDPVFSALLDGEDPADGFAEVALENFAGGDQSYLDNTAVLTTTLRDSAGAALRITDFAPRFKQYDRVYRPAMLVRRIEPISGLPMIRIRTRPLFDHGRQKPQRTFGSNHVRYVAGDLVLRLTTDAPISYLESESAFALAGPLNLMLGPDETVPASIGHRVRDFLERTLDYWVEWVRYLSVPFEWQEAVIRAAITIKLCSFEDTGAIVAALTTSIPEAPDSGRNWDYRACWLRDAYLAVHALNRLGATRTMEDFLGYITTIAARDAEADLKPVYGILPDQTLEEREVTTLKGYRAMGPVRVGNLAEGQVQNDSYGSVILAAAQMFFDRRLPRRGDGDLYQRLERLGVRAARYAFREDAGIWEFRGRRAIHTHSAALCWAACDRLAKIGEALGDETRGRRWRAEADGIRQRILARAWNSDVGSFVSVFGGRDVDASLLLLQEIGLVAASDPRYLTTLETITRELRRGDHLFRYAAPDDFGLPQTSFIVCTFWYIDALAAVGRRDEARALFEGVLARRNHVGLLSEDLDPATGELWGNYPQTYSLVGLILCAMRLSKSWEEAFWRGW
ncbi:MAG TPA: glycoside hydrolase family 15 protein [Candidatus Udaeobacter sp.]|nr:glycoside hydrolase family 15 protein [Candidatus Udaeobacter sp.]